MRGDAMPLVKLLEGAKTRFVIPVYQRNYDWKREQCTKLFDDLESVVSECRESHFFGSIVSQADYDRRVLIDGQQRITTVFVLLVALLKQVKNGKMKSEDARGTCDFIRNEYLVDRYVKTGDANKLKLKLVKGDQEALVQVMSGNDSALIFTSNVTANYLYFIDRIEKSLLTAEQLWGAVERLVVIDIRLERGDDAQLIFESLNSTGLDLSEGDKIRNFVLMNLPENEQERCYVSYWNKIERNTSFNTSSFIRDYLTAITGHTPVISRVYPIFKEFAKGRDTEPLLEEMLRYSTYAKQIAEGSCGSPDANSTLRRLSLLDMSVVNPFLLRLLDDYSNGKLDDFDLSATIEIVESFLFRRWVVGLPTNSLSKIFEVLYTEVMRGVTGGASYADVVAYALLRRDGTGRFPTDAEFHLGYEAKDFYKIGSRRLYLYDRLENGDNVERVNVVKMLEDDTLSVEHVMPQTLSQAWREALGDDADEIHEKWLCRMGNLTLTGYNSQYSNNPFADKRDREHGFKDSGLKLNRFIASCDTWGKAQIVERDNRIWARFLKLWPMAKTSYKPVAVERDSHCLDEDFDFTGTVPAAYLFKGNRRVAGSWVDVLKGLLPSLYIEDPSVFTLIAFGNRFPARYFLHEEPEYGFEVTSGLYVRPNLSTTSKMEMLKRFVAAIPSVEESDISFELRGDNKGE